MLGKEEWQYHHICNPYVQTTDFLILLVTCWWRTWRSPCHSWVLTSSLCSLPPQLALICPWTCAQNKCWDGSSPCANHRGLSWRSPQESMWEVIAQDLPACWGCEHFRLERHSLLGQRKGLQCGGQGRGLHTSQSATLFVLCFAQQHHKAFCFLRSEIIGMDVILITNEKKPICMEPWTVLEKLFLKAPDFFSRVECILQPTGMLRLEAEIPLTLTSYVFWITTEFYQQLILCT